MATRTASWNDLLPLAGGPDGRRLVHALAERFAAASGLDGFALYGEAGGRWRRHLTSGAGEFPDCPTGEHSLGSYDLPRGTLLYAPATASSDDFDAHTLLTLLCAFEAHRLEARLKRQDFAANFRGVELESLYDVGLAVARTLDLEALGDEVLLRAVSLLDARVGALYLRDGDTLRRDRTFGADAPETIHPDHPEILGLLEDGTRSEMLLPGTEHQLGIPIEADGKALGLLVVADKESRKGVGPFGDADRRMLGLFANQAAIALENAHLHREALEKERLERELDLAADIQRKLLPDDLPEVAGFEFAGWSRPARHVGGDYYDVRRGEDGGVHLVLGDVSGKGMPAALLVSTLHSALRLLSNSRAFEAALFESLNQHIVTSSASNKFITMTAAKLDPATGSLTYVNAGHNPPLLLRRGGAVEELPAGGMPLGIFAGATYRVGTAQLDPGDLLCIFSDGITECEAPDGEEFGDERLAELLRGAEENSLSELVLAIDQAAAEFAAGAPQGDDQTIVLLRRS